MNNVEGVDELIRKLNTIEGGITAGLSKIVLAGAAMLEGAIKISMNDGKSGRTYRRGKKLHTASAPGETPAIDYGALLNSIHVDIEEVDQSHAVARVFTNAEYGPALEFSPPHVRGRPFMRPAVDKNEARVQAAAAATLKRIIEEAANA
jgi:hypothetical protein